MARSTLLPICILSFHTLRLDGNQRVSTLLNHGWPDVAQVISLNYAINVSLISHSHPCSAIICCNFGTFLHDLYLSTRLCNTPMLKYLPFTFYQLNLMNLFTVLVSNKIVMVNLTIRWLMIQMLLSGLCNRAYSYQWSLVYWK